MKGMMVMEIQQAMDELEQLQKKLYAYTVAQSSLYLDGVTVAPRDTAAGRGVALGILAGEQHKIFSDPKVGEMLETLAQAGEQLTAEQRRQVELLSREYRQLSRIPAQEYMEYAMLVNEASDVWHRAKETNDFLLFAPVLEKLVAYNRRFAGYYDPDKAPYDALLNEYERGITKAPYDALLNEYERGITMEQLDQFFATVRDRLVPIIHAIGEKEQPDVSFLHRRYPVEDQRKFSDYLMEVMGLDRGHCAIGETEHPFTLGFNTQDLRITTHYLEDDVASSMYSVIHEGGHARYELDVNPDYDYTCLTGGASMGIHESQSRFYENIIGRSLPFIEAIFPKMQEFFPQQLSDVTAQQMYRAVNMAQPSLIRTEADELTYCLHVMVRYEMEKQLIGGTLAVKDVPAEWNRLYKEYLGVDVPGGGRARRHPRLSPGFPLVRRHDRLLPLLCPGQRLWGPDAAQHGEGRGCVGQRGPRRPEPGHRVAHRKDPPLWLYAMLDPKELVEQACGDFDPTVYTDYLTEKYSKLYNL